MTLLDLVSQEVTLRQQGAEWWGCCPFHQEKSPSFSVNVEKGKYYCFGCGAKGDAITWLRLKRGLSFRDAAALVGKELPPRDGEARATERALKEQLLSEHFLWWHRKLAETCDFAIDLSRERDIAEVAYRATEQHPDWFTDDERDYWAEFLSALYDAIPPAELDAERVTTMPQHERWEWWQRERTP